MGMGLFLGGVAFAYFIVLPQALAFFYQDAESLGWNTSPEGSPEKAEYDDLVTRKATVQEWKDATDARVAALAAALTAAGIDPVTYLPLP